MSKDKMSKIKFYFNLFMLTCFVACAWYGYVLIGNLPINFFTSSLIPVILEFILLGCYYSQNEVK